jgi:predicted amidophosphoribosyltransferase
MGTNKKTVISEKICPVCEKPHRTIWDYCLKCMNELGYEACVNIQKIKERKNEKELLHSKKEEM